MKALRILGVTSQHPCLATGNRTLDLPFSDPSYPDWMASSNVRNWPLAGRPLGARMGPPPPTRTPLARLATPCGTSAHTPERCHDCRWITTLPKAAELSDIPGTPNSQPPT